MASADFPTAAVAQRRLATCVAQLSPSPVSSSPPPARSLGRCVVVTGCRTPFCKSFTELLYADSIHLGSAAVGGVLARTRIDPAIIDSLIMGNVVVNSASPNLAREILFDLNLPPSIACTTVSMACLSGLESISIGVNEIECGRSSVIIAGGSDSTSNAELPMPRKLTQALGKYQMGGGNKLGMAGISQFLDMAGPISSWAPQPNSVAERVSGKTMGWHADIMAEINEIPRAEQELWACQSHEKATKAAALIAAEVVPVKNPKSKKMIEKDNLTRANLEPAKLAKIGSAFRKEDKMTNAGTITAATSTALTDGASAVLLMDEKKAISLGFPADVSVRAYVKLGYNPIPQLLLAPALAIPKCIQQAGLTKDDIDIWEIHEAFAAQTLVTLKVLEDPKWCANHLGMKDGQSFGRIDRSKINPRGGSLAIGHPFAGSGARLVTSATNELRQMKKRFALISICAAGGLGGVMILERTEL